MTSTVTLQVNEKRLVKNLMNAFSNRHTFLSELMQNARRAGSDYVRFICRQDGERCELIIEDGGHGIANMQNLLTVADSGWSEGIVQTEAPFGMGFMSALFAASEIEVYSCAKRLKFSRQDALDLRPLSVDDYPLISEPNQDVTTCIVLKGMALSRYDIEYGVRNYAKGFPIRVIFNGEECERSHAVDVLSWQQGASDHYDHLVELPGVGFAALSKRTSSFETYLLGINVKAGRSRYFVGEHAPIVHLDPQMFTARLPDRDRLINEDEARLKIEEAIKLWWMKKIEAERPLLPVPKLLKEYWTLMKEFGMDAVINQTPAVPGSCFSKIQGVPNLRRMGDCLDGIHEREITREMVASGEVVVCYGLPGDIDGFRMIPALIAKLKGWYVLTDNLPQDHWIYDYALNLEDDGATVQYHPLAEFKFCESVDIQVVLTEQPIRLLWKGHESETDSLPVTFYVDEEGAAELQDYLRAELGSGVAAGQYHRCRNILVFPKHANARDALLLVDGYCDGDYEFYDHELSLDGERLSLQVMSYRGTDPAELLESILDDGRFSLPNARGSAVLVLTNSRGCRRTVNLSHLFSQDFVGDFKAEIQALKDLAA